VTAAAPPGQSDAAQRAGAGSGEELVGARHRSLNYQQEVFPLEQAIPALEKLGTKPIGGSQSDDWNDVIASQASNSIWKSANPEVAENQLNAVVAGLYFISPKDELEGMLAAQLMAAHNAAMECYRRAMIEGQTSVGRSEALTQANKLSRTYAGLLDTLNRHRGKGQQKVTVEREAAPVARDAERPLLDARRPVHRSTQRKQKRA
jgi:hypothetical protein